MTWSRQVALDGRVDAVVLNSGGANACTGAQGFADTHRTAEQVADGARRLVRTTSSSAPPASSASCCRWTRSSRASTPPPPRCAATAARTPPVAIMHDRHRAQAVASPSATAGPSAGWPRAPGCSRPRSRRCSSSSTTDAVVDGRPGSTTSCAPPRRDLRPRRLRRLPVDQRHRAAAGVRAPRASVAGADELAARRDRGVRRPGPPARRRRRGRPPRHRHRGRSARASEADALEVGRSVARNNLFKCAVFGNDPNWGRVLAAVGTTERRRSTRWPSTSR